MQDLIYPLGNIPPEDFLKNYWQKKTLVVRNAFPNFQCPISAEELAGLSCEEEINARILIEKDGEHPWQAVFGPMDDEIFASMPESHWTLIINDLEKIIPEFSWIPDLFNFIPEWRFDDLMCSYAADQGSVGPHFDLYDVFIIQGEGKRRWQISTAEVANDNQVSETPLRIQSEFNAEEEWILEPGDMIYIPPGVSHYGVSLGDSISFSVGYRAVSHADILGDFIAHITQNCPPELTYRDSDLKAQANTGEIKADAIARVKKILVQYLDPNHPEIARWFGRFMSDSKSDRLEQEMQSFNNAEELLDAINNGENLYRHPASRFAFIKNAEHSQLFIDGHDYQVSSKFAESLCKTRRVDAQLFKLATAEQKQLLLDLFHAGSLYLD